MVGARLGGAISLLGRSVVPNKQGNFSGRNVWTPLTVIKMSSEKTRSSSGRVRSTPNCSRISLVSRSRGGDFVPDGSSFLPGFSAGDGEQALGAGRNEGATLVGAGLVVAASPLAHPAAESR